MSESAGSPRTLADPPWRFINRTGKMAPEHRRLSRYGTLTVDEIAALPAGQAAPDRAHLYLWVPNALLPEGLRVMEAWGFRYKSNIVWHKVRKDGGSDGRGVGFYFRNVTELVLFGVRGKNARTLAPGRRQVNLHRDPQARALAQAGRAIRDHRGVQPRARTWSCSRGERASSGRTGGIRRTTTIAPTWETYAYNSSQQRSRGPILKAS